MDYSIDWGEYFQIYINILLTLLAVSTISMWIIFEKAGYAGWISIVPIYSTITLLRIVDRPVTGVFLLLIPIVNIFYLIWITHLLVKKFRKGEEFTVGVLFFPLIFYPLLAHPETKFYTETINEKPSYEREEEYSNISEESTTSSSPFLVISLMCMFASTFIWTCFSNLVEEWYTYKFIMGLTSLLYPVSITFLVLSSSKKHKTWACILGGLLLYMNIINQIIPIFKSPLSVFEF